METQQLSVDRGKTIHWGNTSGSTVTLTVLTADGAEISFNILHGHSARVVAGTAGLTCNIHPCDQSLVGVSENE
jgi:hypothetical protein